MMMWVMMMNDDVGDDGDHHLAGDDDDVGDHHLDGDLAARATRPVVSEASAETSAKLAETSAKQREW